MNSYRHVYIYHYIITSLLCTVRLFLWICHSIYIAQNRDNWCSCVYTLCDPGKYHYTCWIISWISKYVSRWHSSFASSPYTTNTNENYEQYSAMSRDQHPQAPADMVDVYWPAVSFHDAEYNGILNSQLNLSHYRSIVSPASTHITSNNIWHIWE